MSADHTFARVIFTNHATYRNDQRFAGNLDSQSIAKRISQWGSGYECGEQFRLRIGVAIYACVRSNDGIVVKTILFAKGNKLPASKRRIADEDWRDVGKRLRKARHHRKKGRGNKGEENF